MLKGELSIKRKRKTVKQNKKTMKERDANREANILIEFEYSSDERFERVKNAQEVTGITNTVLIKRPMY